MSRMIKKPKLEFDSEADAMYIQLRQGKVSKTRTLRSTAGDMINLDISDDDKVIGIEILREWATAR